MILQTTQNNLENDENLVQLLEI